MSYGPLRRQAGSYTQPRFLRAGVLVWQQPNRPPLLLQQHSPSIFC
ncbi:hypothetical protein [Pseudomonas protegens]|nr:hypothetical protein [Pseudomonas protegens]MDP9527680.1 hypothetical protein [Pseudomonas protegens]